MPRQAQGSRPAVQAGAGSRSFPDGLRRYTATRSARSEMHCAEISILAFSRVSPRPSRTVIYMVLSGFADTFGIANTPDSAVTACRESYYSGYCVILQQ